MLRPTKKRDPQTKVRRSGTRILMVYIDDGSKLQGTVKLGHMGRR